MKTLLTITLAAVALSGCRSPLAMDRQTVTVTIGEGATVGDILVEGGQQQDSATEGGGTVTPSVDMDGPAMADAAVRAGIPASSAMMPSGIGGPFSPSSPTTTTAPNAMGFDPAPRPITKP